MALALLPFVVSAVALVVDVGSDHHPASDTAGIELRTRDVGRHPVLTGLYGRGGWDHPGPALFYALALPYRLSGSSSIGLHLGALLINGLAIAGMATVAKRLGGRPLLLLTLVGCGLLVRALGPGFVRDPWNPWLPVLPFGLFLFLIWATTCGKARALPVAAAVASFCVQTHIGYAPLVVPLLAVGTGSLLWRAHRERRAAAGGGPHSSRAVRRAVLVAGAVLAVMWAPPLIEEVANWPGNLSEIGAYFLRGGDQENHTLAEGYRVVGSQFSLAPDWLTGTGNEPYPFKSGDESEFLHSAPVPVLLVVFVVVALLVARRRGPAESRFVGIVGLALCLGMLAVALTLGRLYEYRLGWTWVLAMAALVAVAWAGWTRVSSAVRGAESTLLVPLSVSALLVLTGVNAASAARAGDPTEETSRLVTTLGRQVMVALPRGDGDVILRCDGDEGCIYQVGLFLWLEREGVRVRVDAPSGLLGSGATHRVHRGGAARAVLRVAVNDTLDSLSTQGKLRRVAYAESVGVFMTSPHPLLEHRRAPHSLHRRHESPHHRAGRLPAPDQVSFADSSTPR